MVSKIYMIQKDDANCIYIGEWSNDSKAISDKQDIPLNSVDHIRSFIFSLAGGHVVGVKSTYIDKTNSIIQGKDLSVDA